MNQFGQRLASSIAPRLELLRALGEHQHVTKVAEALDVPQPTVSRWLAEIGRELGAPLIVRAGRGVQLTRAGALLAEAAEHALGTLEAGCQRVAEEVDPERGHVGLGFLHAFGRTVVPELLRGFRAAHPHVRFSLAQAGHDVVLARLRSGELDLALVRWVAGIPDDLRFVPLLIHPLVVVLPDGHRLAGRTEVRMAELADEEFVELEAGFGLRQITDELCAAAGFTPKLAFEGQDTETLRALVSAGLGVALLPPADQTPPPGVVELPVSPRANRTVGLAWVNGRPLPPACRTFRDYALSTSDLH